MPGPGDALLFCRQQEPFQGESKDNKNPTPHPKRRQTPCVQFFSLEMQCQMLTVSLAAKSLQEFATVLRNLEDERMRMVRPLCAGSRAVAPRTPWGQ